jgi:hypothetical protein
MAKKRFNFKEYLDIGNISANWFYQNFGFVLFCFFLILLYIANAHYAENKVKKIQVMQREIKELRWEYMSIQSRIMQNTTQSELSKDVAPTGLNLTSARKPFKIVIE